MQFAGQDTDSCAKRVDDESAGGRGFVRKLYESGSERAAQGMGGPAMFKTGFNRQVSKTRMRMIFMSDYPSAASCHAEVDEEI